MEDFFTEIDKDFNEMKKKREDSECLESLQNAVSTIEGNKLVTKKTTAIKNEGGEEVVDIMFSEFFILIRKK